MDFRSNFISFTKNFKDQRLYLLKFSIGIQLLEETKTILVFHSFIFVRIHTSWLWINSWTSKDSSTNHSTSTSSSKSFYFFLLKLSKRIISKFHYLLILESLSERFFRIFRRFLIFRRGETFASVFPGFIKTKEASLPREEEQPAKYIYCIIILF